MIIAPAIVNNFSDVVGYAAYPVYTNFSLPESRLSINNNLLSASDYAIYKTGYYSINGGAWQNFSLLGNTLSGNWLTNTATYNLPSFPTGESYIVIYTCSKNNNVWDCHDNKWQLQIINSGTSSAPQITFIPPTPNNGATINTSSTEIKANITDDSNTISSWIDFDKSLVGYWSMDYSSSTGIYDNSSYKNFGTFTGGLSTNNIITGVRGKALSFDGIDDYINAGNSNSLNSIGCYNSISLWIKPRSLSDYEMYISKFYDAGPYGYGFDFGLMSDGKAVIMYRDATAISDDFTNSAIFSTNTWTNLVVIQNGPNNVDIYANGQFLEKMVDLPCMINRNIDALTIGSRSNELYFNGTIDEVMIFNRSLAATEVKALYDSKANKFDATLTGLANGPHSYTVYAIDGSGNLASSGQRTINVNSAACIPSCSNKQCGSDGCYGTCGNCLPNQTCNSNGACVNNVITPTCSDGIQNQEETGIDCGGPCSACSSTGPIYYISTTGSDTASGSINSPWKTLAHACSVVTTPGAVIHVNQGTFVETSRCYLAPGVSIEGEGKDVSIIKSQVAGSVGSNTFTIMLSSSSITNGNQHISNIKMDGNALTAYGAIQVYRRSNVEIYNCAFVDFSDWGVSFKGADNGLTEPTVWATGNKFHDNTVTNCAAYVWSGYNDPVNPSQRPIADYGNGQAALGVDEQDGMLVYNNVLTQTGRESWHNGYLIKGVAGYNKGLKIYNNTITKNPYDGITWDFAIELWSCRGGVEIYNNVVEGGIDLSSGGGASGIGSQKGSYAYSVWIHNNKIGRASFSDNHYLTKGIYIEESAESILIERNDIRNVGIGVYYPLAAKDDGSGSSLSDINIRYNLFENIGTEDSYSEYDGWGTYMSSQPPTSNYVIKNYNVYNNVFIAHSGVNVPEWGIQIPDIGTVSNVNIRNNIIQGFKNEPIYGSVSVNGLSIENNIFYNNKNSNNPIYTGSATVQNNYLSNPIFISSTNFHLNTGSPAIDKGISISGLTSDYDGNSVPYPAGGATDIGAYEYR